MIRAFILMALWLGGTGWAWAFDLKRPETLKYDVVWGPIQVGYAELSYAPAGKKNYALQAKVWDESSLIELTDVWKSSGVLTEAGKFMPARYEARQRENNYRADKVVVFDKAKKQAVYINNIDKNDKAAPLAWNGDVPDVLAAVYGWRVAGVDEVKQGGTLDVIGVKRAFTLQHSAGVRKVLKTKNGSQVVWDVKLTMLVGGKAKKDTWLVRLRDDAQLTPIEIVANTKFGSFRARLRS